VKFPLSMCALASFVIGQQAPSLNPAPATTNASISGIVRDAGTGTPLPNYIVATDVNATWVDNAIIETKTTREIRSTTDDQGRYKLNDLPPDRYRVTVTNPQRGFLTSVTKTITLNGASLDGINFNMVREGSISGKVVDQNGEPIPGLTVHLISREYFEGSLGYFFKGAGNTNDRGEYTIEGVAPGHPYLVLVEERPGKVPAHSDVPLNPKLRRRIPERTWYPGTDQKESAMVVVIRAGEHREGIDIEVRKSPSYCIEGAFQTPRGPAETDFRIEPLQPSSGVSNGGGMYFAMSTGSTPSDGKFRICNLYPGAYRLTGMENQSPDSLPAAFSATTLTILDRDLQNLSVPALPRLSLSGEVIWEGDAPQDPITAHVTVFLQPLLRTMFMGESLDVRPNVGEGFSFPSLLMDDYAVSSMLRVPGMYINDITYGGQSVMHERLRLGSAVGNTGMRVVIGRDGAKFTAQVADKDGNPAQNMRVLILPELIASEAMLADVLITGESDQMGQYTSRTLAPGKYYVVACDQEFDSTPESIAKLWRSRTQFKEVELAPNGSAQIKLEPLKIE